MPLSWPSFHLKRRAYLPTGGGFDGAGRGFVEGEGAAGFGLGLAEGAVGLLALLVAGGARAGVAQEGEGPGALVAVFPVDGDAGAFGDQGRGLCGG